MAISQDKNISESSFGKLGWLVDRWIYTEGKDITYENWAKTNDSLYSGESYTVRDGDTVFNEQLKIEKMGNDVFYTAIVKHNPGPVSFRMVELGDNKVVFENPERDFPARITYELRDNSMLYAKAEGKNKNGKATAFELFYTRAR